MVRFQYSYALEKFEEAVYALATGEGDVRSRLRVAYARFHHLQDSAVPSDIWDDLVWISDQLMKRGVGRLWDGSPHTDAITNTLKRMRNRQGAEIARKICSVHFHLRMIREDLMRSQMNSAS